MSAWIRRHRTAALGAAWLAGTVLVVVVGIQAVAAVTDSVTEARPSPLSVGAVDQALAREREQAPTGTPTTTGATPPSTGVTATTATTGAPGRSTATTTTRPRTGTTHPAGGGATTTTSSPTATSTTTGPTGAAPTGGAEDRTYNLTGGSVGVRFENGTARLLWATPAPGFQAERHGGDGDVDVRFRSDSHESRLRAFWDNGPQAEVEENPRS